MEDLDFIAFPKEATPTAPNASSAPKLLTSHPPPWQCPLSPSQHRPRPFVRLHNEILSFCDFSSPSRLELSQRRIAFEEVKDCILSLFPSATVEIFGSHLTGIITPSSDIDIAMLNVPIKSTTQRINSTSKSKKKKEAVDGGEEVVVAEEEEEEDVLGPLFLLAELLKERRLVSYCEVISSAKVPIVKLDHRATGISVDICCNNSSGLATGALMRAFAKEFPPMRPLTMVLKVFLAQRRMNDTYNGGVGSFLLCGLIVSFLQMRLRREKTQARRLSWNLGALLLDFFELYGLRFNYVHTGISLNEDGAYFSKYARGGDWFNRNRPNMLALENPSSTDLDIGRSSFMMAKIRRSFEHAHQLLCAALVDDRIESYLSYVIRTDDPLLINRAPPELGASRYNQFEDLVKSPEKSNTSSKRKDKEGANDSNSATTSSSKKRKIDAGELKSSR